MDSRERTDLFRSVQDDLANVIGASGKPDELVRLTTSIVQGTKKFLVGIPDDLSSRSTAALTAFVKAARHIAKNPQAVDAKAVQELSSTRRAVETLVNQLESWHSSFTPMEEDVLEEFSERKSSPEAPPVSKQEARLVKELEQYKKQLLSKTEPQQNPPKHDKTEEMLSMGLKGVLRGAEELVKIGDGRPPSREQLLDPMVLVSKWVCVLLDIVDSLFISKYPMRSQVHSFTSTFIDCALSYKAKSKSDDASTVRTISTQTPALVHAVEVMEDQCQKRCQTLEESRDFSIKRNTELGELHSGKKKNRGKPPEPPKPKKKQVIEEFEIGCIVCTSVAVDQKTQQPLTRGTELSLVITEQTKVIEMKQDLSGRTGLPVDHIKINQGSEELQNDALLQPAIPLPYFLFNEYEPTENELREIRKDQRRQNRLTVMNLDWSKVTTPIALAIYEYDTLGDETSLDFDEGDIIEITEKSADGWWEGRIGDKVGSFPASFVEEIHNREEGLRLMKMMKSDRTRSPGNRAPPAEKMSSTEEKRIPRVLSTPNTETAGSSSPRLLAKVKNPLKLIRGNSNPDFPTSQPEVKSPTKSKKLKKNKGKYASLDEEPSEESEPVSNRSPSPTKKALIPPKRSKPSRPPPPVPYVHKPKVLGQDTPVEKPASPVPPEVTEKPKLSPQMNYKRASASEPGIKKRPPPPLPPPFAVTHPNQATKLNAIIKASIEEEEEPKPKEPAAVSSELNGLEPPSNLGNKSTSMEELFKNLEDFEVKDDPQLASGKRTSQLNPDISLYEIVEPHPAPRPESASSGSQDDNVITIKISEFKPDSEEEDDDDEEDDVSIGRRVSDNFGEEVLSEVMKWRGSPVTQRKSLEAQTEVDRPSSAVPLVSHVRRAEETRPPRSLGSSPSLDITRQNGKISPSPPPVAPPRVRKKEGGSSQRIARGPPPPPPKPKVLVNVRTSRSDLNLAASGSRSPSSPQASSKRPHNSVSDLQDDPAAIGHRSRRWTMAVGRECLLGSKSTPPTTRSRSPMVQRRTKVSIGPTSPTLCYDGKRFSQMECTGLGKEGILYKEASNSTGQDWKARHFKLLEDGLIYFDSDYRPTDTSPIGELPIIKMHKAVGLGEKDGLQCFALLIRYDSSVILGSYSKLEIQDWARSINLVIEADRMKEKTISYIPAHSAAVTVLTYLTSPDSTLDKSTLLSPVDTESIRPWLDQIDAGEAADLSYLSNDATTIGLLRELFTAQRIGPIITNDIAMDLSQQVKRSCPIQDAQSKLHHLSDDALQLLRLILLFFSKILSSEGDCEVEFSDLNRLFGSVLFENLKKNQSLTLIAYLTINKGEIFS